MTTDNSRRATLEGFERMFNQGDLDYVDEALAPGAVDHQEPDGTDFAAHLKHVISTLRTAFPDLHFDVHELVCEGDSVACRSTMTGTHQGPLRIGPTRRPGRERRRRIEVPHMHFFRYDDDRPPHRPVARLEHACARPPARRARTRSERRRTRLKRDRRD